MIKLTLLLCTGLPLLLDLIIMIWGRRRATTRFYSLARQPLVQTDPDCELARARSRGCICAHAYKYNNTRVGGADRRQRGRRRKNSREKKHDNSWCIYTFPMHATGNFHVAYTINFGKKWLQLERIHVCVHLTIMVHMIVYTTNLEEKKW